MSLGIVLFLIFLEFEDLQNFQNFHQFFYPKIPNFKSLFPLATGYRGPNPLACASAVSIKSREKSKKWMLMREKLNFFKKSVPNFRIDLYLQPAVDRQPGRRRGDREAVGTSIPMRLRTKVIRNTRPGIKISYRTIYVDQKPGSAQNTGTMLCTKE